MGRIVLLAVLFVTLGAGRVAPSGFIGLRGGAGFPEGGVYPTTVGATSGLAYGSWNGSDASTGVLRSDPFRAPAAIELEVAGYPTHPGLSIALERVDSGQRYVLRVVSDPGEQWARERFEAPVSWHGAAVRLVAQDASTAFQGWEGVADLRLLPLTASLASEHLEAILLLLELFALWLLPGAVAAALGLTRFGLDPRTAFPIALLTSSAIALLTFFLSLPLAALGRSFGWAIVATTLVAAVWPPRAALFRAFAQPDVYWPFALTLGGALIVTGLLFATGINGDLGAGAEIAYTWRLPPDNILPSLLADHVARHLPAKPFLGEWLSSDRPPLQAGLDLFARLVHPNDSDNLRYCMVSVAAQCSALGMVFGLARVAGASIRRSLFVTAAVACTGFFLINSVYVWPKLFAAALGGGAIILFQTIRSPRAAYVAAGLSFGLGMMAHGGVVFTLPVLALVALLRERGRTLVPFGLGLAAMLAVMTPWSLYAHFVDPPGNRLLKWHLAGRIPVDTTTFNRALVDAYTTVPPAKLAGYKWANVRALLGPSTELNRANQFFGTVPALGGLPLGLLALALTAWRMRGRIWRERDVAYLGLALAGLTVWCALMYGPGTTVVHQGSYLTQILLMTGLALAASRFIPLAIAVATLQLWLLVTVYLLPFDAPLSSFVALTLGASVIAAAAVAAARQRGEQFHLMEQTHTVSLNGARFGNEIEQGRG